MSKRSQASITEAASDNIENGDPYLQVLKHAVTAQLLLLSVEEAEAFRAYSKLYREEHRPEGPTEEFLVASLADLSWSCQQIRVHITNLIVQHGQTSGSLLDLGRHPFDLAQAGFLIERAQEMNMVGLLEQRKMQLFHETLKQLKQIQSARHGA